MWSMAQSLMAIRQQAEGIPDVAQTPSAYPYAVGPEKIGWPPADFSEDL